MELGDFLAGFVPKWSLNDTLCLTFPSSRKRYKSFSDLLFLFCTRKTVICLF